MSVSNLKEYARRCASEPEVAAEAKSIGVSDLEGQMRYAGSLGLEWGEDDLVSFRQEVIDAEGEIQDIGEEDLERVAGGIVTVTAAIAAGVVAAGVAGGVVAGGAVAGVAVGATAATSTTGSW